MQTIVGRISRYKEKRARLHALRQRIGHVRQRIAEAEKGRGYGSSAPKPYKGVALDGLPKGNQVWGNNPDGKDTMFELQLVELYEMLDTLRNEVRTLDAEVETIAEALTALNERERLIIENFYMDNLGWTCTVKRYKDKYGFDASVRALQRMRDGGLKKLERILNA